MRASRTLAWGGPGAFLLLLLAACAPLPQVLSGPPYAEEVRPARVRVVVAGMRSPQEARPYWDFLGGLEALLGERVEVFGRRTYPKALEALGLVGFSRADGAPYRAVYRRAKEVLP